MKFLLQFIDVQNFACKKSYTSRLDIEWIHPSAYLLIYLLMSTLIKN